MKQLVMASFISLATFAHAIELPPSHNEPSNCPDCHKKEAEDYAQTRMAQAARTPGFLNEWKQNGSSEHCLECHAPSRKEGVTCIDCHSDKGHPYTKLGIPEACIPCHDAPGEVTVRSYRNSPAARRGQDCLDCHQDGDRTSHSFMGPSRPGFMDGIAQMRIALRRDNKESFMMLVGIRHKAGHSLPGGTTGRSVWLVVEEVDNENRTLREVLYRFGWTHSPETGWEDHTLPPGPGKVIEIPIMNHYKTVLLRAKLIYRFAPGELFEPDPREVVLDRVEYVWD